MEEFGRLGWFTIGVATMGLAGAVHAVVGASHIVREVFRIPAGQRRGPGEGGAELEVDSGLGGWILFGALVLAGDALLTRAEGAARSILHLPTDSA